MTKPIDAIVDRQAITDLIYRYCRAMDRIDHELGYALWHEDGEADYGAIFQGGGRQFVDWVCETHSRMIAHSHQISNVLIELDDDGAVSESYVTVNLRFMQGDRRMQETTCGRYIDRWSRRNGRWGVDSRLFIVDLDDVREITKVNVEGWGRRDREDPSYKANCKGAVPELPGSKQRLGHSGSRY